MRSLLFKDRKHKTFSPSYSRHSKSAHLRLNFSCAVNPSDLRPINFGNTIEGASPAKETLAIEAMPKTEGKEAILFCTHRLFGNSRTLNAMEKLLATKGYVTVLKISKKGMTPDKEADFSVILNEVKEALEKQ